MSSSAKNKLSTYIQKVVKQHYVPRHYLSAWGDKCESDKFFIWCKRKDWAAPKYLDTMSVGQKKYMYAYPMLSAKEQSLVIAYIKSKNEVIRNAIAHIYEMALFMPLYLRCLRNEHSKELDNQVAELISSNVISDSFYTTLLEKVHKDLRIDGDDLMGAIKDIETVCNNGFEWWMTEMEARFYPLLDRARNNDILFFSEDCGRQIFVLYILIQMLRTEKYDYFVDKDKYGRHPVVHKMLRHSMACELAITNAKEWKKYELIELKNTSRLSFITGDQPLVNLDSNDDSPHFDLYFPISPTQALLFIEKNRFASVYGHLSDITEREVHDLNLRICNVCVSQVYANSCETINTGRYFFT